MRSPAAGGWRLQQRGSSSSKLTKRIIHNIRITLLCAFVTLVVLRGTIGVNHRLVQISTSHRAPPGTTKAANDIERILREISADANSDSDDDNTSSPATRYYYDRGVAWSTANYSLGPRVTGRQAPAVASPQPGVPVPRCARQAPHPPRHGLAAGALRR
ncbi:unnamed protein product [Urochloa humidicola]